MSDFQTGEIVDVTIKGVPVDAVHADGTPDIIAEDSDGLATVWALPPQAKVERVAPAEWPPELGDLWRDRLGSVWFALGRRVLMVPGDPVGDLGGYEPDKVLAKVGPLALVHREGADS